MFPFSFLNRFRYPCRMQAWDFPIVFGSQIQTVPIRTCACVYCAEARDMPTSSTDWLSAKKTPSTEKVFLITSQMLVLAPAQYKKKLLSFEQFPSLYSICAAGIVFLKTSLSLSRGSALPRTAPRCSLPQQQLLPLAFLLCAVVFNKSLKPSASIGPSLVLCLIHCRSPTPSAILLRLRPSIFFSVEIPSSQYEYPY